MKRIIKTGIIIFSLLVSLMAAMNNSITSYAHENLVVVRVGYAGSENFTGGASEGARKSGYAYEYLQLVAANAGWRYEYVYGEWSDLFMMLQNGEIDVMPGVSYTEERAETVSYPNDAMGREYYYMIANEDSPISSSDDESIVGTRVGCIRTSVQELQFREWNEENGNPCNIVLFAGYNDLFEAFDAGSIDMVIDTDNGAASLKSVKMVKNIGGSEYYLAVSKQRTDLLATLNKTLSDINLKNPYLIPNMEFKYFTNERVQKGFSQEDIDYLKENPLIRIAYVKNFMAFCGYDEKTGECKGGLRVFVDNLYKNYGTDLFKIELLPYDTIQDCLDAVQREEADIAYTLYQSYYYAEQNHFHLSNGLASTNMVAIFPEDELLDEFADNTVAVTKGYTDIIWFVEENYPNWTIKEYDTFDECKAAIDVGEADCIVESAYVYKNFVDYRTVRMISLSNSAELCFAVDEDNIHLLHLLNQAIATNPKAEFITALTTYANVTKEMSLTDYIRAHIWWFSGALLAIVLVLSLLLVKVFHEQRKTKKARTELVAALDEAEAASQAKTVFLNNMSHDIRTPMNAIIGFTQLMQKRADNPEVVLDYASKIEDSGDYLLSIINNVLDMARIESGKVELDEQIINIADTEKYMREMFEEESKKRNLTLVVTQDIKHWYAVADPAKITQIMINLMSNAIKYTPDGGEIHLEATELPCDKEGYATYQIAIRDNGIGMSKEFQEEIFESFSRERTTTESKVIGTGLGMSIVKKLVDLMGGTIEVESELGKGTSFIVTMTHKYVEEPFAQSAQQLDNNTTLVGKRILLAEDNDLNAEIAEAVLEDLEIISERARDGVECIDLLTKAEAGYYNLILMDIQMPNLDGYNATKRIRMLEDSEKAQIPIVAMTANAFEEDKKKALDVGMNEHLSKPIEVDKIIEVLSKLL